jgi:O-acetyl-ADP-ribose deacetylase (regulator of RNase III)
LKLAKENDVKSIAFPAISCGVYGYPIGEACKIAIDTTRGFMESDIAMERVVFVLFSRDDYQVYTDYLNTIS